MSTVKEIENLLIDLKENHCVIGLKSSFEDEGANLTETKLLKDIASSLNLKMTVKIAGCEALRDIQDAKSVGADVVVAPMIESSYALKKFVTAVNSEFCDCYIKRPEFFINIETLSGYRNLDEILSSNEASFIDGVVVGRSDMARSLGLQCKDANGDEVENITCDIGCKVSKYRKKLIIGGNISKSTIDKISFLPVDSIQGIETRKILFSSNILSDKNKFQEGLKKAIEFEILWLKRISATAENQNNRVLNRISLLEKRYEILR